MKVSKRTKNRKKAYIIRIGGIIVFCLLVGAGLYFRSFIVSYIFIGAAYISPLPAVLSSQSQKNSDVFQSNLSQTLKKEHISYTSIIYIQESTYKVTTKNGEVLLFTSRRSLDEQMSSLQLILSSLTIEGKHFQKIDLRFEKPVVVFK